MRSHGLEVPQFFAGFEVADSLRWHLDLGSGLRIAAGTCPSVAETEAAEAPDFDRFALVKGLGHRLEGRVDYGLGRLLGDAGV